MNPAKEDTVRAWPKHPAIYEINTWVWLSEVGGSTGGAWTSARFRAEEWDAIASLGFDAVWFMGVWERSPAGIEISMRNPGLLEDFRRALPDFSPVDNVGSPYCVRRYVVDEHLGGAKGLAAARRALAERGLRLLLDFVPNHVAPDHPWVGQHPDYFIRGSAEDARKDEKSFTEVAGTVFALGRDPFFPAWPDVLQLNAFHPGLRQAVVETLSEIAEQCDGVRCDMAMLFLNQIFERTWGARAGPRPADDYWASVIPAIKERHPGFKFIAEAYWDLEWELQQQGFDHCYDKKLYDRMEHGDAENVRLHLLADRAYQDGMVRFIENHDEPRAAAAFPPGKARAAAVAVLTLPGARLLHEGQLEGRKVRLPVFLGRRPEERSGRGPPRLLRAVAGGGRARRVPRRGVATLRSERVARQPDPSERAGLVLGEGGRAMAGRDQLRPGRGPGPRPRPVGGTGRQDLAAHRYPVRRDLRAAGGRDDWHRPVRGPGAVEVPPVPAGVGVSVDMHDVRPDQYAMVIREMIRHENDVTSHRVTWLLIGQGFIANAYVSGRKEGALDDSILLLGGILVALSVGLVRLARPSLTHHLDERGPP